MIGQTISHFRIVEKLGEGGMGVVYKAEDTNLKRTVAIKFLPHGLEAHEPERVRFLQEAQAASAINHPHVCTIYEISQHEGQQFIVMEYVDGKTLRQLVPLQKTQTAIDYAIQIGEALQEAHSKGIVHRDVKTDNIMVNAKNQIKVMDFGLAKLKGSLKLTKTSSTVGTLAYMAPEQIEGGEVDARSDIFSFGVVLYEMLTGHLPFRGEHEAAMVYSIVNEEPTPIQKHLPDVSSELVHILNRALEKDPEDRYQFVHEMVIDLRRLKKQTSRVTRLALSAKPNPEPSLSAEQLPANLKHRHWMRIVAILFTTMLLASVVSVLLFWPHGWQLNPDMKFRTIQIPFRNVRYADVSADGNWLVFPAADEGGKYDVYVMNVSRGQPRRVTYDSCNYISDASISPDASTILYSRRLMPDQPLELVSVPFLGSTGRVIIETISGGTNWRPDGERISYVVYGKSGDGSGRFTKEFWTSKPDGSDRRCMFADTIPTQTGLRQGWGWSSGGKSIAWTRNCAGGYTEIVIRNLESGKERQLTFDKKIADDPLWVGGNDIVFSSNRGGNVNLWLISVDGGEPVRLTRGSGPDAPMWISADGRRMIYSEGQNLGHIKIGDLRDGSVRQLTEDERYRQGASISSTGAFIAFVGREEDEYSVRSEIYLMDRRGGEVRKLTDTPEIKVNPYWSHDDKYITYGAYSPNEPADSSRIFLIKVDNPGQPRLVGKGLIASWYDDKNFITWAGRRASRGSINSPDLIPFAEDSVWLCPVVDGKYMCAYDGMGVWITSAQSYESVGLREARQVVIG